MRRFLYLTLLALCVVCLTTLAGAAPNEEPKVTLRFQSEPLQSALKQLFEAAGVPYRLDAPQADGKVTANLVSVRLDLALRTVLGQSRPPLRHRLEQGTYVLFQAEAEPAAKPASSQTGVLSLFDSRAPLSADWKALVLPGATGKLPKVAPNGELELGDQEGTLWYARRTFSNLQLVVEWRVESPGAKAGVWLRSPQMAPDSTSPKQGHLILIHEGGKNPAVKTGAIPGYTGAEPRSKPPAVWNTLEVLVTASNYQVSVNGEAVARYVCEHSNEGYLGLASTAGPRVFIRKILVYDLSVPRAETVEAPGIRTRRPRSITEIASGHPALQAAASGNTPAVINYLDQGGDVNARDNNGRSLLHAASGAGKAQTVRALIERGVYVDAVTTNGGQSALHLAVTGGHLGVVEMLKAAKADLELEDAQGRTAGELAATAGNHELARLLAPPAVTVAEGYGVEWNQWRGPERSGVAPHFRSLPSDWGPAGPALLWRSRGLPFGGSGGPVVSGGRLYGYLHDHRGNADVVVCLDAGSGKQIWQRRLPTSHTWHEASGTPAVQGDDLYVVGARSVYRLNATSGATRWTVPIGRNSEDPAIRANSQEYSTSPLIYGTNVWLCSGRMVALEQDNGAMKWSAPEPGGYSGAMTSIALWKKRSKTFGIYVGYGGLFCVDMSSGEFYWKHPGINAGYGFASSPAISGDLVAVTAWDKLGVFRLTTQRPVPLWSVPYTDNYSSPIIWKGSVYAVGKTGRGTPPTVSCRDALTGRVRWAVEVDRPEYSSPVLADGKLFALTENGARLVIVDADPANGGKIVGSINVGAYRWTSPMVSDGRLYLRTPDGFSCYDLRERNEGIAERWNPGWKTLRCGTEMDPGVRTILNRERVLVTHPVSRTVSAAIEKTITVPAKSATLRVTVTSYPMDAIGDWELRVSIDGERIATQTVRSQGKWQTFDFDLARFVGKSVKVTLENAPGGTNPWFFEAGYWHSVEVLGAIPAGPSQKETKEPKQPGADRRIIIEGKTLLERSTAKGAAPSLRTLPPSELPADSQVFWSPKLGDRLSTTIDVEVAGTYAITAGFAGNSDNGRFQLEVNGVKLGQPLNLYAPALHHLAYHELGTCVLQKGANVLTWEALPRDAASSGNLFGWDRLILAPPKTASQEKKRKTDGQSGSP